MRAAEEQCPSENTVVELLEADLSAERRAEIGDHVDRCARCRQLVAVMARTPLASTDLGDREPFARGSEPPSEEVGDRLRAGDELGRYRIEEMLGQGGMGAVYAARDPELDRRVAVKVIRPGLAGLSEMVATRLSREARAMAQVAHPNVIAVHDVGRRGDQVFVAMELASGQTLRGWLSAEPRTWRQIVDVFRSAGEGLAAAHAARLVHRDFKPDNVLVDPGGRVRVTDFGLARAVAQSADAAEAGPAGESGASRLLPNLTGTGAAVGTPAYMAPEQYAHHPTDERTDQFSFCIALWEALYRERPFAGESVPDLAEAVLCGRMRPAPRRPRLPGWLRRAMLRGLSVVPEDRFRSMRHLLHAIRPRSRRRLAAAAASVALASAVGLMAALADDESETRCAGGAALIGSVWNEGTRAALQANVLKAGGGTPQAQVRWQLMERAIDRYARAWTSMHTDICAATERGDQSTELLDLRFRCLDTRLAELRDAVHALETPDPTMVAYVASAVEHFGSVEVERCSAVEVLEARMPIPTDPTERAEVDKLRHEQRQAEILRLTGRVVESRAALEKLLAKAEALGYRPFIADVLFLLGDLQIDADGPKEAEATLRRALHMAEAGRHDIRVASSLILLIDVASQRTHDLDKAAEYAERARAALDRMGPSPKLEGQYEAHLGGLEWARGRFDRAVEHYRAARRLFEESHATDMLILLDRTMGTLSMIQGDFGEALRFNQAALAGNEKMLGPDHPEVALGLDHVADALMGLARYEESLAALQRGLEIRQRANGPEHVDCGKTSNNMAEVLRRMGRYDEALERHRRGLAIVERAYGAEHPAVATAIGDAALIYIELGQLDEALPRLRRALDIHARARGEDNVETIRAAVNMAVGLRLVGRFAEALEEDRRALAGGERTTGGDSLESVHARLGVGLDLIGLGRHREARAELERAGPLLERLAGDDPETVGQARFGLAQALWPDRASRPRARELAQAAAAVLQGVPGEPARLRARVISWLEAHSR